jgi:hypothetical protein
MLYPNHIVKKGDNDTAAVAAIQQALNSRSCGPLPVNGKFDDATFSAVKLFQTRNTDKAGTPLREDGKVGPVTWAALFGADQVPVSTETGSPLALKALQVAISQIGVVEEPPGSNRGPMVDMYLRATGLNPEGQHYSWCAAFVYWCFGEAAKSLNISNPLVKTAGCLEHWNRATCPRILRRTALTTPTAILPGAVFIIDHGGGKGHTGIVESTAAGLLTTIEGNTNLELSSNGYGVFRLTRRKIADINKGFLIY